MSKVLPEDETRTIAQVKRPDPINRDKNQTWLRHKLFGETGEMDLLILEGKYTVEEIAQKLSQNKNFTPKPLNQWISTVKNHILHLSTKEGDSRNRASGQRGHNLRMKKGSIVRFDY